MKQGKGSGKGSSGKMPFGMKPGGKAMPKGSSKSSKATGKKKK